MEMIRSARFAGSWYPDDPEQLRSLIEESVEDARKQGTFLKGPYRFAVLPHAGLFYSRKGIAPFFTSDLSPIRRVLVIAPSHYTVLPADTLVSAPLSACETALGTLSAFRLGFAKEAWFPVIQAEHALEMVLPFFAALPNPPEVALALVSQVSSPHVVEELSDQLLSELGMQSVADGQCAIIASSDFTHYGPRFGYTPYQTMDSPSRVKEDDLALSHLLCDGRVEEALAFCYAKRSTVCGYAPALLVSSIAKRMKSQGWVASYYTSLDISSSPDSNFVAYSTILWR